jgi:hypothetical protein
MPADAIPNPTEIREEPKLSVSINPWGHLQENGAREYHTNRETDPF